MYAPQAKLRYYYHYHYNRGNTNNLSAFTLYQPVTKRAIDLPRQQQKLAVSNASLYTDRLLHISRVTQRLN